MTTFYKDWRNIALIVAAIVIVSMIGSMLSPGKVVRVGNRTITEREVVNELKQSAGDKVVMDFMTEALLDSYARKQGLSVSQREIDQLLKAQRLQLGLSGQNLEDALKSQDMSMDAYLRQLRTIAFQVKLLVTPDEMKAGFDTLLRSKDPIFMLPTHYKIHEMFYGSMEAAKAAYAEAQKEGEGGGVIKAIGMSLLPEDAQKEKLYMPGVKPILPFLPENDTEKTKVLAGLKAGELSRPFGLAGQKGAARMVQLIEVYPSDTPTLENRSLLVGQFVMQTNKEKYGRRAKDLEAKALNDVDIQFYAGEYKRAYERFHTAKTENPNLPNLQLPNAINNDGSAVVTPVVPAPATPGTK